MSHNRHHISPKPGLWSAYQYAFNGMERQDELSGVGNNYDFGARMYDARLGRFFSVDPIFSQLPGKSHFSIAGNNPTNNIDVNGNVPVPVIYVVYEGAVVAIALVGTYMVARQVTNLILNPRPITLPAIDYAKYSPGYDWQRRQAKSKKALAWAEKLAIEQAIQNNMIQGDDDPERGRKMSESGGRPIAITLFALEVINSMENYLMILANDQESDMITLEEEIERLETMENADEEIVNKRKSELVNLREEYQGTQDALCRITEEKEAVKKEGEFNDPSIQRVDQLDIQVNVPQELMEE